MITSWFKVRWPDFFYLNNSSLLKEKEQFVIVKMYRMWKHQWNKYDQYTVRFLPKKYGKLKDIKKKNQNKII